MPTIEIDLDEDGSLDEIINLFVDINQQGEKVKIFEIVKAIGAENPLLQSALKLVAIQQKRKEDVLFKKKSTHFTCVMQKLQVIQSAADQNNQVDRMWERLVEIVLFSRTGKHRAPGQILKNFINSKVGDDTAKITPAELKKLGSVFAFLDTAYKETALSDTRLARDTIHFYTTVTTILAANLLAASGAAPNYVALRKKFIAFSGLIERPNAIHNEKIGKALKEYLQAARTQTTHSGQREIRQSRMLEILKQL
jgi:hypothetical protein